jgi:hypothetical protein
MATSYPLARTRRKKVMFTARNFCSTRNDAVGSMDERVKRPRTEAERGVHAASTSKPKDVIKQFKAFGLTHGEAG